MVSGRGRGGARYEWLYVYGFARPKTGASFCALLPRVRAERMGAALAAFAANADPAGKKVPGRAGRQRGRARGQAPRGAAQRRTALFALYAGVAAGRAVLAVGPRGGGESIGRMDRLRAILRSRLGYLASHPELVQPVVGF